MSASTRELFDTLASVLLRCWVLGFVLLLVWLGAITLLGDVIYGLHGDLFGLSEHELAVMHYSGMGLFKMGVLTLFLCPWVAIELVLKKKDT